MLDKIPFGEPEMAGKMGSGSYSLCAGPRILGNRYAIQANQAFRGDSAESPILERYEEAARDPLLYPLGTVPRLESVSPGAAVTVGIADRGKSTGHARNA